MCTAHAGFIIRSCANYTDLQYLNFHPKLNGSSPYGKFLLALMILNALRFLKVWNLKWGSELGCCMYSQKQEKQQTKTHTIPDQDVFLCEPRAKSETTKTY